MFAPESLHGRLVISMKPNLPHEARATRDKGLSSHSSLPAQVWGRPPSCLNLRDNEIHVWRLNLEIPEHRVNALLGFLDEDEVLRAYRFRRKVHTRRFIAAHGQLRAMLSRYLRVEPDRVRFRQNRWGKPVLAPEVHEAAPQFSFSRSNQAALCAVSQDRIVGVDIEHIRPLDQHEQIAERYFSPAEIEALASTPTATRNRAFFSIWTRKEAYVKALGLGLSIPLKEFDVSSGPTVDTISPGTDSSSHHSTRLLLHELELEPEYVGAVAVEGVTAVIRCWEWPNDQPATPDL